MPKSYLSVKGRRTAREIFEPGGDQRMEKRYRDRARFYDESWARLSSDWVVNGMYSRNVLASGPRELCAVAALTALGHHEELRDHIRMALRTNKNAAQVREAIIQMAVYAGMPAALSGMRVYEDVLREPEFRRRARGRARRNV